MQENNIYLLIIIGFIIALFLLVSILLIFNLSKRRVLAEVTEKQKMDIEFQSQLLKNNIETQEKERARIAKELHDDIGSQLNVINLSCNVLENSVKSGNDPDVHLSQIRDSLKDCIGRIREISHNLFPPILEKFGLQSALQSLTIDINKTGQVKVNLEIGKDWGKLNLNQELNIYRIIQELISNTIKHAEANQIDITSELSQDDLTFTYMDDGKGFNKDLDKYKGMGLSNIRTRASLLNAKLEMKNNTGKGVCIKLIIPKS